MRNAKLSFSRAASCSFRRAFSAFVIVLVAETERYRNWIYCGSADFVLSEQAVQGRAPEKCQAFLQHNPAWVQRAPVDATTEESLSPGDGDFTKIGR